MIKAIQLNNSGEPIKGSERSFSNKEWAELQRMFADKLCWRKFGKQEETPTLKKEVKKVKEVKEVTKNEE